MSEYARFCVIANNGEGKPLVFRDTMISNVRDLVDVVPRLNIFGDDRLAQLCQEVKDRIAHADPATLRPSPQYNPNIRHQVKRDADALKEKFAGYFGAPAVDRGGRLMASRARRESASRVSHCVTALLRDQPFFGSLALRLPIRPDAARETLASDGREIRYSPDWVANTDADLIKTAIGRVVLACALKHHTRRGERDPGRWQQASQLVTHGLLRDAGFKLPPDTQAWDGISVEQAYDRLPEPQEGGGEGSDGPPSAGNGGGAAGPQPDADDDAAGGEDDDGEPQEQEPQGEDGPDANDANAPADASSDGDPQADDAPAEDGPSDAPASCDPSGTGEVMDAPAGSGDKAGPGQAPPDVSAEEQAWDEAMHQALNLAKAQGKAPGEPGAPLDHADGGEPRPRRHFPQRRDPLLRRCSLGARLLERRPAAARKRSKPHESGRQPDRHSLRRDTGQGPCSQRRSLRPPHVLTASPVNRRLPASTHSSMSRTS